MKLFPHTNIKIDTIKSVDETIVAFRKAADRRWYDTDGADLYHDQLSDPFGQYNDDFIAWSEGDNICFKIGTFLNQDKLKPIVRGRIYSNTNGSTVEATIRYSIIQQILLIIAFGLSIGLFISAAVNMIIKVHFNFAIVIAGILIAFLYYVSYYRFKGWAESITNNIKSVIAE